MHDFQIQQAPNPVVQWYPKKNSGVFVPIYVENLTLHDFIIFNKTTKNKFYADNLKIIDNNELLKLLNSEVNSCKNVDFKVFGLSLATINFLLSFLIFVLILKVILNEKNK